MTDVLELHIISLPRLLELEKKKRLPKTETELYIWSEFLLSPKDVEVKDMENDKALKKAIEVFEDLKQDEHERYLAELRMKHILDSQAIKDYGYQEGLKERRTK